MKGKSLRDGEYLCPVCCGSGITGRLTSSTGFGPLDTITDGSCKTCDGSGVVGEETFTRLTTPPQPPQPTTYETAAGQASQAVPDRTTDGRIEAKKARFQDWKRRQAP